LAREQKKYFAFAMSRRIVACIARATDAIDRETPLDTGRNRTAKGDVESSGLEFSSECNAVPCLLSQSWCRGWGSNPHALADPGF
jgi:hypothetical protein